MAQDQGDTEGVWEAVYHSLLVCSMFLQQCVRACIIMMPYIVFRHVI